LYAALGRGGEPRRIVAARSLQTAMRRLLACLPRLGLLVETCRLLETAQLMESRHPVGPGSVTEFDRVFAVACKAVTRCLAVSASEWSKKKSRKNGKLFSRRDDADLIDCVECAIEVMLRSWLGHSRGVRLSVLATVSDSRQWNRLKRFIETYGRALFTQEFMNLGNLRGILHRGVREYLESLRDQSDSEESYRLVAELDAAIPLDEAARWLGVAIEAVVENYGEYVDYNSITTQSDRGDMLYTLLDFLRLRASYERWAWNLRPVALAHETLVRCGRDGAAAIWRFAVAERTGPMADEHLRRFNALCKTYGMRLPSIAERLAERFVRPLEVDRLCALLRQAIQELREGGVSLALASLEEQVGRFTQLPPGAGYELPGWLDALEREAENAAWQPAGELNIDEEEELLDFVFRVPETRLSREEVERQIRLLFREG